MLPQIQSLMKGKIHGASGMPLMGAIDLFDGRFHAFFMGQVSQLTYPIALQTVSTLSS